MAEPKKDKVKISEFPKTFWVVIFFEFIERGSYYGVMSVLAEYLTEYLGFSYVGVGAIQGTVFPFLIYGLPIIMGAVGDRLGYRKTLMFAFSFLGLGYFITSQMTGYATVVLGLIVMGIGAGSFKPIISGTIAKVTDERTGSLGFGIYYWAINLGAFLFPLILVPTLKVYNAELKAFDISNVLLVAAIATGSMILPTIFIFREPDRQKGNKEDLWVIITGILKKIWMVILDWRFILFIFIYSWFWIVYFQMFGTVLWYVSNFVNATPLNEALKPILSVFGITWKFDVEAVTVINAGTIIALQLLISNIVKKTKPLPTMITGIMFGTIGMAILAMSNNIWIFIAGIIIFSLGEMTAHPKFISYLGIIAPRDKKATYMGFGFLYGVFGSFAGGLLGGILYPIFVKYPLFEGLKHKFAEIGAKITLTDDMKISQALELAKKAGLTTEQAASYAHTSELWLLFSSIGIVCIAGLLIYEKFIGTRTADDVK